MEGGPAKLARAAKPVGAKPQSAMFGGIFAGEIKSKNFTNAAYGVILLNADMVKRESRCLKLLESRRKTHNIGRIPSSKTTVKYNRRFFVNAGTVHFACRRHKAP